MSPFRLLRQLDGREVLGSWMVAQNFSRPVRTFATSTLVPSSSKRYSSGTWRFSAMIRPAMP